MWTNDELTRIGNAEELEIASQRADGSLRRPTTIWVVRHENDLYVRSVNGRTSDWFRRMQARHAGQVTAGGVTKDVAFEEVRADDPRQEAINAAYAEKYRRYPSIVPSINSPVARAATIRVVVGQPAEPTD